MEKRIVIKKGGEELLAKLDELKAIYGIATYVGVVKHITDLALEANKKSQSIFIKKLG